MKEQKFSPDIVDMISTTLDRIRQGGLKYIPSYSFDLCRVEYYIKDDRDYLEDGSAKFVELVKLDNNAGTFNGYISECKRLGKQPSHNQYVICLTLLNYIKRFLKKDIIDQAFNFKIYGALKKNKEFAVPVYRFGSDTITVRLINRKNEFFSFKTPIPKNVTMELRQVLEESNIALQILNMERGTNITLSGDQIMEYVINYM